VQKYNDYKMFVSPEELVGLPSVNVFEGMACKCAFIGINDPIYTDIGMIPGVHYIDYNGDFSDLVEKIRHYQNHPQELKKIAEEGYNFVKRNFNKKSIADVFWDDLEKISRNFSDNKEVDIICSFVKNKQNKLGDAEITPGKNI